MRRAAALVALIVSSLVLSGCFTWAANSRVSNYEQGVEDKWGTSPSSWAPLDGARRLVCPLRCGGSSPVWVLPGPGDSLFLTLPKGVGRWDPAVLTDRSEPCAEPAPDGAPPLDLVVSPEPLALAPASLGGIPTRAVLVLHLAPDRWRQDTSLTSGEGSTVFFERDGIRCVVPFEERFAAMRARNAARARAWGRLWWLVSVPLDVATSPVQLAAAIVAAPFLLVLLMGLGGHRW